MTKQKNTDLNEQGSDQQVKQQLCDCGHAEHYEDAKYCVNCGRKLK